MKPYYQLSGEEVLREVNGSEEPLTKEQVSENQKKYGPNELTEGKKKTTVQIFLEQYKDFLVIILIIAAIASGFMGDIESAAVIVIVITMNAILGTVQTVKAEASLASLKKLSGPEAKVLRDGVVVPIPSAEVTVGDIIMLEAGDYIPADGRILECASMKVDESALTGESLGVEKTTDVIEQDEVPLGDRINMVYSGSFLTYGRGSFVVTEIGMNTEVGKIASLLKTTCPAGAAAPRLRPSARGGRAGARAARANRSSQGSRPAAGSPRYHKNAGAPARRSPGGAPSGGSCRAAPAVSVR